MSEITYSLDRDLEEARALAQGLENYVRGERLYGSAGADVGIFSSAANMPTLTIGALLLRLHRLKALESQMSAAQKALLTEAEAEHDRVRREWTVHYGDKVRDEAAARLRSLEAFFAECEDDQENCAGAYLPEALGRTMLQEIVTALNRYNMADIGFDRSLAQHDTQLRRFTEPSKFIWSEKLRPAYPENPYWWLYAHPSVEEHQEQR